MARSNYRKRTRKISNNASVSLHPALENLKERLSSPRLKANSTISTYLETSARFLFGLGKDREPTDTDFRRYFVRRRQQTGKKLIDSLDSEETEVLNRYCSISAEALLKMGAQRKASIEEVVVNAFKNGIALGLQLSISDSEVKGR